MKKIIVYHDTETLASRARKPAPGETIGYRAKADFDDKINATFDEVIDLSMFIYPVESQVVLENLRKKVSQLEAGLQIDSEKGRVRDPGKQAAVADAEEMRDKLQVGEERFFRFGIYFTIYGSSMDELEFVAHKVESILGQQLVYSKTSTLF